jgi:hypothetical protein
MIHETVILPPVLHKYETSYLAVRENLRLENIFVNKIFQPKIEKVLGG